MTLYMEVTDDEYELPVAVADSARELSRMRGVDKHTVSSAIWRKNKRGFKFCKYVKVVVEDD